MVSFFLSGWLNVSVIESGRTDGIWELPIIRSWENVLLTENGIVDNSNLSTKCSKFLSAGRGKSYNQTLKKIGVRAILNQKCLPGWTYMWLITSIYSFCCIWFGEVFCFLISAFVVCPLRTQEENIDFQGRFLILLKENKNPIVIGAEKVLKCEYASWQHLKGIPTLLSLFRDFILSK